MVNEYNVPKLTPWDMELCRMVESLTGKPCEPMDGGSEQFFIVVDYSEIKDIDVVAAIVASVDGRVGQRLVDKIDKPDERKIVIHIKFSEENLPVYGGGKVSDGNPVHGDKYCRKMEEIRALKVTRENLGKLIAFVGNGEMAMPENEPCVFTFLNAGTVYAHAPENSYVVYASPGRYAVISEDVFKGEFERK